MIWVALILFALLGGWLSRMCGGAPPKLPFGLDQWIYALPYLFITFPALIIMLMTINPRRGYKQYLPIMLALAGYSGAVLGKRTGHGGGMDAGHSDDEPYNSREPEKLEFLILWLHGKIPQYWYDILLLTITGLAVTLLSGIIVAFINPFWGVFLALSGATKGVAYMIGWHHYPTGEGNGFKWLNEATAIGEFLTGYFAYAALGMVAMGIF